MLCLSNQGYQRYFCPNNISLNFETIFYLFDKYELFFGQAHSIKTVILSSLNMAVTALWNLDTGFVLLEI